MQFSVIALIIIVLAALLVIAYLGFCALAVKLREKKKDDWEDKHK